MWSFLWILFSSVVHFASCENKLEKLPLYCEHLCTPCGGLWFLQNEICYCRLNIGNVENECIEKARKKSQSLGIQLTVVDGSQRIIRTARPIKGSFLDPVVANVFEDDPEVMENRFERNIGLPPYLLENTNAMNELEEAFPSMTDVENHHIVPRTTWWKKNRHRVVPRSIPDIDNNLLESTLHRIKSYLREDNADASNKEKRQKRSLDAPKSFLPDLAAFLPEGFQLVSYTDNENKRQSRCARNRVQMRMNPSQISEEEPTAAESNTNPFYVPGRTKRLQDSSDNEEYNKIHGPMKFTFADFKTFSRNPQALKKRINALLESFKARKMAYESMYDSSSESVENTESPTVVISTNPQIDNDVIMMTLEDDDNANDINPVMQNINEYNPMM